MLSKIILAPVKACQGLLVGQFNQLNEDFILEGGGHVRMNVNINHRNRSVVVNLTFSGGKNFKSFEYFCGEIMALYQVNVGAFVTRPSYCSNSVNFIFTCSAKTYDQILDKMIKRGYISPSDKESVGCIEKEESLN